MIDTKAILGRLESNALLFSAVHRIGGGTDTSRRVFVNLVHAGAVVIEIGANQGIYTALFSRLVGRTGQVHAFEPVSSSFERLLARVHSLGATNISACQMAVADGPASEREIIIPGVDSEQASLVRHIAGSWANSNQTRSELVQVTSLDAYLMKHDISHVDFVKLDVEGAELSVLQSGRECFTRQKPALHLEIESEWLHDFGATADDLFQLLRSYGYKFAYRVDAKRLKGFRRIDESEYSALFSERVSGDFLFSAWPL